GAQRGPRHPALRAHRDGAGADDARGAGDRYRRRASSGNATRVDGGARGDDRRAKACSEQTVRSVTLDADALEADAREQTGLRDFGDGYHREGLERLVASMNEEADLSETGEISQRMRLG